MYDLSIAITIQDKDLPFLENMIQSLQYSEFSKENVEIVICGFGRLSGKDRMKLQEYSKIREGYFWDCSGKYIMFMNPWDSFDLRYMKYMKQRADKSSPDLIVPQPWSRFLYLQDQPNDYEFHTTEEFRHLFWEDQFNGNLSGFWIKREQVCNRIFTSLEQEGDTLLLGEILSNDYLNIVQEEDAIFIRHKQLSCDPVKSVVAMSQIFALKYNMESIYKITPKEYRGSQYVSRYSFVVFEIARRLASSNLNLYGNLINMMTGNNIYDPSSFQTRSCDTSRYLELVQIAGLPNILEGRVESGRDWD